MSRAPKWTLADCPFRTDDKVTYFLGPKKLPIPARVVAPRSPTFTSIRFDVPTYVSGSPRNGILADNRYLERVGDGSQA